MLQDHFGGDYIYLGLLNRIRRILSENQAAIPVKIINLIVNVDGIPLRKSSGAKFWLILCRFHKLLPRTGNLPILHARP